MLKVPTYKRILSFFTSVLLQEGSSDLHPILNTYLRNNHLQLATDGALYGDVRNYRPLKKAFSRIRNELPAFHNVLLLGTGLASAVHLLHSYGLHPHYTLVDLDETILGLALTYLPEDVTNAVTPVCADAAHFITQNTQQYDLVILDVFLGQQVPAFVTSKEFLLHCRETLTQQGILIFNYIREGSRQFKQVQDIVKGVFGSVMLIEFGINDVFVCRKNN